MLKSDCASNRCNPITLTDCGVSCRVNGSRVVVAGCARPTVPLTLT
ncbi:hypothetical protein XOCgx_4724 [Xanthomonas oryzae pv. oryzicola]|nr:hypothetical protein XOCgx_4724 [Xanthomonas oryzae pv. oryzicola]